jgi:hypothetical protein
MIKKKKTHKKLNKQRLNVKKIQNKFLNLIKLLFPWKYRFAFHSVPICLVPSTEMSSTEYRNGAYVQYRDVLIPFIPLSRMRWRSVGPLLSFPIDSQFISMSWTCLKMYYKSVYCKYSTSI